MPHHPTSARGHSPSHISHALDTLHSLLLTLAFCLVLSAVQYAFTPERSYAVPLVYSLSIGIATWGLVEIGRRILRTHTPTDGTVPRHLGLRWLCIGLVSVIGGGLLGTFLADAWFGWSTFDNAQIFRRSALITVTAGVAAIAFFYQRGKSLALSRLHTEARLRLLHSQLEPHMLFNTLAHLRALIAQEPSRAVQLLDHLDALLRQTLKASRQSLHTVEEEWAYAAHYLALMQQRMGERLCVDLHADSDCLHARLPTLIVQPLIENAIRHGLELKVQGGTLSVHCQQVDAARLQITVEDDGLGFNARLQAEQAPSSYGLAHVRERLQAHFGPRAELTVQSPLREAGGTRVQITLPLELARP